ncbi:Protein BCCIP-like protein [Bienertia sinuspersici]
MECSGKRVLVTTNGDDVSINIAYNLAKKGCSIGDKITDSINDHDAIKVVGLDMEDDRETSFYGAVEKACNLLGNLDAFVDCILKKAKCKTL